jgi:hypothetical protein
MALLHVSRGLVLALGAVSVGLFVFVVVQRLRFPVDGEWMTSAVREGVERVRDGQPIYLAPNERFIPFLYPPLYTWTCALVARVASSFVACKVVSLASTAATAFSIERIAATLGASKFWRATGVLLFFGAYGITLSFYDLERVDVFAAMIVAFGVLAILRERTIAGGVLLGVAFFAKQPHVLAIGGAAIGLALAGERRRALVVVASGAAAFAALFAYLEVSTGGWFRYYCVKLPGTHGVEARLLSTFFITDLPRLVLPAASTIALAVGAVRRRDSWREVVFSIVAATTMIEALLLRAHDGGWANVIIAWTPLGCAAAAVMCSRLCDEARGTSMPAMLMGVAALELLGGFFDPFEASPEAGDVADRDRLVSLVRGLEKEGEVVVTTTGLVSQPRHFHAAALKDVLRAGEPMPEDIRRGIVEHRYAAILVDSPWHFSCRGPIRCDEAFTMLLSNYFVGGRRHERDHTAMSGLDARPRWIMRPRKTPLVGLPREALEARMRREMAFASAHADPQREDEQAIIDDAIEDAP